MQWLIVHPLKGNELLLWFGPSGVTQVEPIEYRDNMGRPVEGARLSPVNGASLIVRETLEEINRLLREA